MTSRRLRPHSPLARNPHGQHAENGQVFRLPLFVYLPNDDYRCVVAESYNADLNT